jgi:sRNA-binding carbon storage regulator CsrA
MLVLGRKVGQRLLLGNEVILTVALAAVDLGAGETK